MINLEYLMTIILTNHNTYLPLKYQKSDYPKILNTIETLTNLEITSEIIDCQELYQTYLNQYYRDLNEYPNATIIMQHESGLSNIKVPYHLIKIDRLISENDLEALINENSNN